MLAVEMMMRTASSIERSQPHRGRLTRGWVMLEPETLLCSYSTR